MYFKQHSFIAENNKRDPEASPDLLNQYYLLTIHPVKQRYMPFQHQLRP